MNPDLKMPTDLSVEGEMAYKAILAFFQEQMPEGVHTGGKTFYSPAEWKERGETYGCDSELIVVYDGSSVANYFSMDHSYPTYKGTEAMNAALDAVGLYSQECTGWYSAIYKD